jgi:uncharacterized protein HemY
MPEDRLRTIENLLRDDPDDAVLHFMLGEEHLKGKRFDDAAKAFRRAVECKADYTAAYRELGKALREAGRKGEAIHAFEEGLAVAERTGDVQTGKEIRVFLNRMAGAG